MPTATTRRNHRAQAAKVSSYKQKLIAKGVVDGTSKMNSLLCKFASKHFR